MDAVRQAPAFAGTIAGVRGCAQLTQTETRIRIEKALQGTSSPALVCDRLSSLSRSRSECRFDLSDCPSDFPVLLPPIPWSLTSTTRQRSLEAQMNPGR